MAQNVIPSDRPSVFDGLSDEQQFALAYPAPYPSGIAGLKFDFVGDEKLELRSEITDSYVEDNTAIHDQITLVPERFTVDASTAELVFAPSQIVGSPPQPANPLPVAPTLVPQLSPGAQEAQSAKAAASTSNSAGGVTNLWQYYQSKTGGPLTRQATVMGFIYQLWKGRQRFTVETPWGIFTDMVIELAQGTQPEETLGRTDHHITFKKIRFAEEPQVTPQVQAGRAYSQAAAGSPSLNGNIGQVTFSSDQQSKAIANMDDGLNPLATLPIL